MWGMKPKRRGPCSAGLWARFRDVFLSLNLGGWWVPGPFLECNKVATAVRGPRWEVAGETAVSIFWKTNGLGSETFYEKCYPLLWELPPFGLLTFRLPPSLRLTHNTQSLLFISLERREALVQRTQRSSPVWRIHGTFLRRVHQEFSLCTNDTLPPAHSTQNRRMADLSVLGFSKSFPPIHMSFT